MEVKNLEFDQMASFKAFSMVSRLKESNCIVAALNRFMKSMKGSCLPILMCKRWFMVRFLCTEHRYLVEPVQRQPGEACGEDFA